MAESAGQVSNRLERAIDQVWQLGRLSGAGLRYFASATSRWGWPCLGSKPEAFRQVRSAVRVQWEEGRVRSSAGGQTGREPLAVFEGHGSGEVRCLRSTLDDDRNVAAGLTDRRQDLRSPGHAILGAGDVVLAAPRSVAAKSTCSEVIQTGYYRGREGAVRKVIGTGGTRKPNFWRLAGESEINSKCRGSCRGDIWRRRSGRP